jgi:hypothetical protein
VQRRDASQRQQQQQQPLEDGRCEAAAEIISVPPQQLQQSQHQEIRADHDSASSDGRSTPSLEAPDTPLIPPNASSSVHAEVNLQPPLQQDIGAVGAGTHLSKLDLLFLYFNSGSKNEDMIDCYLIPFSSLNNCSSRAGA